VCRRKLVEIKSQRPRSPHLARRRMSAWPQPAACFHPIRRPTGPTMGHRAPEPQQESARQHDEHTSPTNPRSRGTRTDANQSRRKPAQFCSLCSRQLKIAGCVTRIESPTGDPQISHTVRRVHGLPVSRLSGRSPGARGASEECRRLIGSILKGAWKSKLEIPVD